MDAIQEGYELVRNKILHHGWDYCTIISGGEGTGKSNLGLLLATYAYPDFDGTSVAFHLDELLPQIEKAPKGGTVIFDEAVQGAYRREAMTKENRTLNKVSMIARKRGVHLILNLPNFWDLDSYFRDHRAKVWFLMERRNMALIHFPSRNRYRREVFWTPTTYYDHPNVGPEIWNAYDQAKDAYITRELRNARDPEAEAQTDKETVQAEAIQLYRDRVELCRNNAAYSTAQITALFANMGEHIPHHQAAALSATLRKDKPRKSRNKPQRRPPNEEYTRKDRADDPPGAHS